MGDEQQPIARLGMGFTPAAIVQRRDHRFARTGGRYHQIAVIPAHFPLRPQLIQDGLLIGIGADVKQERLLLTLPFFAFQRFCQPGMGVGSVDFKFKNNFDTDIKIYASTDDKKVTIRITKMPS